MDGNITVTPEELTNNATAFSDAGNNMYSIASNMIATAQSLSSVWGGEAASTYMSKFQTSQTSFDKLKKLIEAHSTALNDLAQLYKQAEAKNVEAANTFKNVLG